MIISSWPGWRWKSWPSPGSSVTSITTRCFEPVFAAAAPADRAPVELVLPDVGLLDEACSSSSPQLTGIDLKRRMFSVIATSVGRRSIERGAEEADDALGVREHVGGVVGLGDRAAVAEDENVGVDALRRVVHRLDELRPTRRASSPTPRRSHRPSSGPCAGRARPRPPRPSPSPRPSSKTYGAVRKSRSWASRIMSTSSPNPIPVSSRPAPDRAVEEADRREVLDAAEADPSQLVEEHGHQPERVGAADAGEDGRLLHDRQHLTRHVDDDRVRVAVRAAGRRASRARPSGSGRSCR